MHNIVKLAKLTIDGGDVIKTAGILQFLKNKIKGWLDPEQAEKAQQLILSTTQLKPLLNETYRLIKKIEDSISSLDADAYNAYLINLKDKINELNIILSQTESSAKPVPPTSTPETSTPEATKKLKTVRTNEPRTFAEINEAMNIYNGKLTLGQLGITASDILDNKQGVTPLHSSFAQAAIYEKGLSEIEVKELENKFTPEFLQAIYDKIPEMKIHKVSAQEIDTRTKQPKNYMGLVTVLSNKIYIPDSNVSFVAKFVLADKRRNADDPIVLQIYRKLVQTVEKSISPRDGAKRMKEQK